MRFLLSFITVLAIMTATIKTQEVLTAKRMIEAHQLDALSVNPAGSHAVVGVKRFSFEKEETSKALYLLNTSGKEAIPKLLSTKSSDALWVSDEEVAYLDDKTLYVKHIDIADDHSSHEHGLMHDVAHYVKQLPGSTRIGQHGKHAGIFPTAPANLRISRKSDHEATLVFSAEVYADGDLTKVPEHDKSEAVKEWQEIKVYDTTMVRHWDQWLYPGKRSQLFAVDLRKHGKGSSATWSFASPFRNLLADTKLESPVKPFGDTAHFDVSATHVIFTARDPSVNAAWHTKHNIYIVPLDGSKAPESLDDGEHGASTSPAFSPMGTHAVWLQMYIDGYEADRNRITLMHIATKKQITVMAEWNHSPESVRFTKDGKSLVGVVEKDGQKRLFTIALHREGDDIVDGQHEVVFLTDGGSVSGVENGARADEFIIAASTFRGPAEVYLVSPGHQSASKANAIKSNVVQLTDFKHAKGSPLADVDFGPEPEHFTYPGANGRDAYAWLIKPPGYDENAKGARSLVTGVHGGPESAWTNGWSKRWNMLAFAAQGHVVLLPNPAGSTGYGQAYTEEILGQLGGAPMVDVELATKHVLDTLDTIDRERVVAAGASYGGFAMNWIQGHNEEKLYKGLVSHDGIFSFQGMAYATEELYFPEYEAGGPVFQPEVREKFAQWSPERFAHKWETPMLVIHGGRDYRLTDGEGLSCFNVLQRKGVESRLLYYPDESHWVVKPKNSLRWHKEVLAWLAKYSNTPSIDESNTQERSLLTFQHAT
jgi:dipeptidyl aminopeptidase/acylaminoacyl peptidase